VDWVSTRSNVFWQEISEPTKHIQATLRSAAARRTPDVQSWAAKNNLLYGKRIMQKFSPQAILLDFYGTVVEEDDLCVGKICEQVAETSPLNPTIPEVGSYWNSIFSRMCTDSVGSSFRYQKDLEQTSLEQVLEHFETDLDSAELSQILIEYWANPTVFPESKPILFKCKMPICLVSNTDNAELNSALKHSDLSFDWVVTSEDCRAYKPRRETFDQALSLLGLRPADVLHVGDSIGRDVRGGKSLGMPVLWINRKNRPMPPDDTPDYSALDLTGLADFLEK
jgi:2-haloalkanoic acid dehalogenase type II